MVGRAWLVVGSLLVIALGGCLGPFTRQSSEETLRDKDLKVLVVGDVTDGKSETELNDVLLQVSAVGLVTGLDGTGGSPPGPFRDMLEKELRKQGVERTREVLDSPNNALVFVSALIPAGTRRGEPIDVEITLPPNSRATSLQGGQLRECALRFYQTVRSHADDRFLAENKLLSGSVMARARGPLMVGLGAPESPVELKRARIWKGPDQGGVVLSERPFYLVMKRNEKSAHVASAVAERLNSLFRDNGRGGDVAKPTKDLLIALTVPNAYSLNPERYLRVARLVPVRETPEEKVRYRERLAKMLLDPKDTVRAALRLEALGQESIPTLKSGLESANFTTGTTKVLTAVEHPLVRFAAAEALTYLGSTAGVEELAVLTQKHPQLRASCLLALASLDESMSRRCLAEMLDRPEAEIRCGAFLAARLGGPDGEKALGGQYCRSFWLHEVAPRSTPLVHLSMKRAEVVLFGGVRLQSPVRIAAGTEFTITSAPAGDQCVVSRIKLREDKQQLTASMQLDDVLRKMAELGAQYPDVVDFLRKADERHCLTCPLRIDAQPEPMSLDALAQAGRDANFLR